MKRLVLLFLACLILLGIFTACGEKVTDTPKANVPGTSSPSIVDPSNTASTPETEPIQQWGPDEVADITDTFDLDGRAIGIIYQHGDTDTSFDSMLGSDEEKASVMDLEEHYRDEYLAEKLNITYKEMAFHYDNLVAGTQQTLLGGDLEWDLAHWNTFRLFKGGMSGLLYDLNELSYVDQSKAYWASNAQSSLSVAGHMFMGFSDYNTDRFAACTCIAFNKQLVEDNNLDNPYELVDNGEWTFDKFISMINTVQHDVNGDGKYTEGDIFGFSSHKNDLVLYFYNGTGNTFIIHDEDDLPVFIAAGSELAQNMWDQLTNHLSNNSAVAIYGNGAYQPLFYKDELLFEATSFGSLSALRDMKSDFGVLPFPKADADQLEYYACGGFNIGGIGVIYTTEIAREIGAFLELGSAYGHQKLIPQFYDNDLKYKISRDPETTKMFGVIMKNAVYDMARLGFWSETSRVYEDGFFAGASLSTVLAAFTDSINKKISTAVDEYLNTLNQ